MPEPNTPRTARIPGGFVVHAIAAILLVSTLNVLIARYVPFSIEKIEQSYLIFYYHLPAALSCLVFFTMVLVASIAVLCSQGAGDAAPSASGRSQEAFTPPRSTPARGWGLRWLCAGSAAWDRRARAAAEVGLLACTITLATGSTWASAAWNTWWDWGDARLMSAAIMWLTYAGYVLLQEQIDDAPRRRRFAAVFGILAFVNIPLVHWAIEWFGETHHPETFQDLASDPQITRTRWFGVFAFFVFYLLLYRWRLAREETKERLESVLARVRRIEEGASS